MVTSKKVTTALRAMGVDPQKHGDLYRWLKTATKASVKSVWPSINTSGDRQLIAKEVTRFLDLVRS